MNIESIAPSTEELNWSKGTPLTEAVGMSQAIATKNRVYLLGGWFNSGASDVVYTAPINVDGTLGGWSKNGSLPETVRSSQAITTKTQVYLLGGVINNATSAVVYTAHINEDGTLGGWTTSASLPGTVYLSQAIVTKNRVYLLGGVINSGASDVVYTAPIKVDGTLGRWTTSASLPGTVYLSQAITTKNRVYLLGGYINGACSAVVYTAPINGDGTLGSWTTSASLPGTVAYSQAIVTKNRVYILGGTINGTWTDVVYTAPINGDGTLGSWAASSSLPVPFRYSQAMVINDKIHLLGGYVDNEWSSSTHTATIADDAEVSPTCSDKAVVLQVKTKTERGDAVKTSLSSARGSLAFCLELVDALKSEDSELFSVYAHGNTGYVTVPPATSLTGLKSLQSEVELQVKLGRNETKISFVL